MAGFQKAEKRKAWIKIALTGPSGSGKTFSALTIASGMGKRIAVVDTENGSASLYADRFDFEVLEIDSPYTIEKYVQAIKLAQEAKFEVLIIDSISHAWAGEGGLLDQKEALDARGGKGEKNKFANWHGITKQHERFKAWLLKADMHLIVTMRSKQDYILGEGNAPQKVGLAPIQREGMEYEQGIVFDLAMNHSAKASKDRTGVFDGRVFVPSIETGREIMAWLNGGKGELVQREVNEVPAPDVRREPAQSADPIAKLRNRMFAIGDECGYTPEDIGALAKQHFPDVKSRRDLTAAQINALITGMKNAPRSKENDPAADEPPAGFPFENGNGRAHNNGEGAGAAQ